MASTHRTFKPAATNPAVFKGAFTGKWQGQNSTGGVLKLDFKSGADSKPGADVLFVYEGTDVRAQTKSLKVEGDQIHIPADVLQRGDKFIVRQGFER